MNTNLKFANIVDHGLVLIDTCFILHPGFENFMTYYKDVIYRNPIIILDTIISELANLSKKDAQLSGRINKQLALVNYYLENNLLQGRKDFAQQTKHADQVLLRIVQQYHPTNDICILTNDKECCKDIYNILDQGSSYHKHNIYVMGFQGPPSSKKLALWEKDGSVKNSFFLA